MQKQKDQKAKAKTTAKPASKAKQQTRKQAAQPAKYKAVTPKSAPKPATKMKASSTTKQNNKQQPTASQPKTSNKSTNTWRNEPGTDQPLRIGRGIRTRDEYFMGQKGKKIHSEQDPSELYRRTVVLEFDDDENLLLVQIKRPNAHRGELVPYDKKGRKYIQDPLTLDDNDEPIRIKKGKFELAPYSEDVREDQARQMSEDTENKTNENKKRFFLFRKNKK